jgi:predicted metal-dependent phosphoesterase TrpH
MLIDLHVHTFESGDAIAAPEELIDRALAIGLDGFVVTEHDSYAASATAADFGEESGVVVLRGVEIATEAGHMLVYGLEDDGWRELARETGAIAAQALVDFARERGAVVVAAHPFRAGATSIGERTSSLAGVFAIEGFNGTATRSENAEACTFATRYELRLTGGSDAHLPGQLGRAVTQFEKRIETMADMVAELKAGRFMGRYLLGPVEV